MWFFEFYIPINTHKTFKIKTKKNTGRVSGLIADPIRTHYGLCYTDLFETSKKARAIRVYL